jgi:hypothetical protein
MKVLWVNFVVFLILPMITCSVVVANKVNSFMTFTTPSDFLRCLTRLDVSLWLTITPKHPRSENNIDPAESDYWFKTKCTYRSPPELSLLLDECVHWKIKWPSDSEIPSDCFAHILSCGFWAINSGFLKSRSECGILSLKNGLNESTGNWPNGRIKYGFIKRCKVTSTAICSAFYSSVSMSN